MKLLPALFMFFALTNFSCVNRSSGDGPDAQDDPDNSESPGRTHRRADGADLIKFEKHKVVDEEGTGMTASTYLLPEGWTVDDKFSWEYRDPTVPVRYQSVATSKDGAMMIQIFSEQGRSWSTGPSGTQGAAPPADIVDGLKFMINVERKGKDISYISSKILAKSSSTGQQGEVTSSQAGVVRVEYEEDGVTMQEEFYGQLYLTDVRTQTALGNTRAIVWRAKSLYSCKAPKGKLDECRAIVQTMQASVTPSKKFFNRLMQVLQLLSDQYYLSIFQAGQISKIISQTNDQMLATIDASYKQTQKSNDRMNEQFSDYIREVDSYTDANGNTIKLPSGFKGGWVNSQGEYIVSNADDPSSEQQGNWSRLEKTQ